MLCPNHGLRCEHEEQRNSWGGSTSPGPDPRILSVAIAAVRSSALLCCKGRFPPSHSQAIYHSRRFYSLLFNAMKLRLNVEQPVNSGGTFTSHEHVRGVVTLVLQNKLTVSSIVVSLLGRLEVHLMRKTINAGELDWVDDKHKVRDVICARTLLKLTAVGFQCLQVSQILFPGPHLPRTSKGYSLSKGVHSFPFSVQFPILSACPKQVPGISHPEASLPPSFLFKAPDHKGHVRIRYWLKVNVRRPGRLQRDGLLEQDIQFLPLNPVLPPPMLSPALSRHQGCCVVLEATIPSPSVLFVGSTIPLRLQVLNSAIPAHEPHPVTLRSITISIQTKTTLMVGMHHNTWTSNQEIVCVSSIELPLDDREAGSVEINSDLWNNAIVPELVPSFTTCTASQQYSLLVTAKFVCGPKQRIDVWNSSLEVGTRGANTCHIGIHNSLQHRSSLP